MNADSLAAKVADFIKHNNIDTNKFTMDQIVQGYFTKQIEAIEEAGQQALEALA